MSTRPLILTGDGLLGVQSNRFGFQGAALPSQVVVVEGSANLLDWLPLQTNVMSGSLFYFQDPQWLERRFYRARLLE